ncbi:hypothetical protein SO802_032162 [Lithocarpus litseifolius]|uniref:Uncharacterized protein n=1 Tax=Lithocarpus litseifolius TaxID=425828 RepID=A0AAW2BMB8_9ROSI
MELQTTKTSIENESDMLNIVVQNLGDSSSGGSDEWLNSILKDGCNTLRRPKILEPTKYFRLKPLNALSHPSKIQKVPNTLEIKSNEKCYDPLLVSIGPYYHHGSPGLQLVEKHKIPMTLQYVKDSGKGIDVLYNKVVEVADNARECYAEGSTQEFDNEAFARMMFLDGCFILQFMYCIAKDERENMGMKSHTIALVHRDMFMLENQLPFLVLKALMSLRFREDEERDIVNICIKHTQALPPLGTLWQERLSVVIPISIWGLEAPQTEPQKYEDQPFQLLLV